MAISQNVYSIWLQNFLAGNMGEEDVQNLINKLESFHEKKVQRALAVMMGYLYSHDYASLKRDLAKILLLGTEREPKPEERIILLQDLWWCIEVFFHSDYSVIFDECERVIASWEQFGDYDHAELPFV